MKKNRVLYKQALDAQAAAEFRDRMLKLQHSNKVVVAAVPAIKVKEYNDVSFYSRSGEFKQGVVSVARLVKTGIRIELDNDAGGYSIIDNDARVAVLTRAQIN